MFAELLGARLAYSDFTKAILDGVILTNANMTYANFTDAGARGSGQCRCPHGNAESDCATGGFCGQNRLMRCRPATPADAAAIATIGREAFPPTYAGSLDAAVISTVVDALYTGQEVATDIRAAESNPDSGRRCHGMRCC